MNGSPGLGGGYWLARQTSEVTLYDVVAQNERVQENVSCPFGPNYGGTGPNCPMHFDMLQLREPIILGAGKSQASRAA